MAGVLGKVAIRGLSITMEYKVVMWDEYMTETLETRINKIASEGWRLVAIHGKSLLSLVFERPVGFDKGS